MDCGFVGSWPGMGFVDLGWLHGFCGGYICIGEERREVGARGTEKGGLGSWGLVFYFALQRLLCFVVGGGKERERIGHPV